MTEKIRVLVVGCGNMGGSHARAYHKMDEFEIVGLVSRGPESRERLSAELGGPPTYECYEKALVEAKPDAVSINTYPDSHAEYCLAALNAGCHVFTEKPLAMTVEQAESVVATARKTGLKLVVGYILRVHPAWQKFIEIARTLGKPLVMRMNLNQQSRGDEWTWHKNLMKSMSPLVDCGVHYVDIMCAMTGAKPVRVHGIGARLTDEIQPGMYNYGHLHVVFDDGSVGWYEAGWGPMMSEQAFFVKDVVGPAGCVSIAKKASGQAGSADIDSHTKTDSLLQHFAELDEKGVPKREDIVIDTEDEPDHQELCNREQALFLRAIREDMDLGEPMEAAVNSLRIVLAADQSYRTGKEVSLTP